MSLAAFLSMVIVISAVAFLYPRWRRSRLLARPFPGEWLGFVERALPFYTRMSMEEQHQLRQLITLFLDDKHFHGCGGQQITDEVRVIIAAEACLLRLNRRTGLYPGLKHILVYPSAFIAARDSINTDGTISEHRHGLLGESWQAGKVILSWADVLQGAADVRDGHNVALHEFSHQLDSESGSANGTPLLRSSRYSQWEQVLSKEYQALQTALKRHKPSVMDYYGATNPAEFFAVATETFFEKPFRMFRRHPQLYAELQTYYRVDPRNWFDEL